MTAPEGRQPHRKTVDVRSTVAAVIEIWNGATADGLDGLLAPGYRGHILGARAGDRVAADYADAIARFRTANPGVAFRVIDQFDAADRCVTRLEATRPAAGSNAASVSQGINISRFDDEGRLAEEWAIWSAWLDTGSERAIGSLA
jgi:hypothetical protein